MRRLILLSIAAAAGITFAACDQAVVPTIAGLGGSVSTDTARGGGPSTSSLIISPSTIQLGVGGTFQFGTNAPLSQRTQVEWSSLNPGVVAMSPSGMATAIAPGLATITARFSFDTAHVATATVTVTGIAVGARTPAQMSGGK